MSAWFDAVSSLKVKLGILVVASVVTAVLLSLLGSAARVPALLVLPVSVALALGVTQLLAAGMVAPLRRMTEVSRAMARGDYSGRVRTTATDEVGQLAAAFNRMAEDLATVDRERRDLIATVSHELRTPLTAMTALLENLADGVVPADRGHLGDALDEARRLGRLVEDLLQLSRLEAGVVHLDHQDVALRALVEDSVAQVLAAGRPGTITLDIADDLLVGADPARLRQLLVNVLDNAARHAPAETSVRVTGGAGTGDGAGPGPGPWWLEVVDEGGGVAPEDRERVFDRFGTDGAGGTGLGLAVARWVAQLHGGTLRFLDPATGSGARLRLEVPATTPPASPSSPTHEPAMATTASASAQQPARRPARQAAQPQGTTAPVRQQPGLDGVFGRFWPEHGAPSGLRTVVAAAAAGLFAGFALSFNAVGITWTLVAIGCGVAALLTARGRRDLWTLACAGLALLLVLPMTLLDAWWVQMLGLLAATAVFLSGVTGARTLAGILLTGISWPLASLRGLPWFARSLRLAGTGSRTPAVVRTTAWSLLGLGVFGTIFASANPVFGSWVDQLVPNLTFNDLVGRAFLACFVFAATLGAAYLALNPADVEVLGGRRPPALANRFEWLVPVLVVDVVFVAFIAAQARALVGGEDYIQATTGLTYADFVHQGFGQLTLATALTVLVVWVASRRAGSTPEDRRWLYASLGVLCALTLLVVASALRGMAVYQDAYGFTTLRLFVDVFEGWLGFVVLSIMVAGVAGVGRWLPRIALVSGAVALIGLAAVNPDAWVAGRNLDRYEATGKLDLRYLETLSADAAPVIVGRLPEEVAGCVLQYLPLNQLRPEALEDARAWNLGRARAEDALEGIDLPSASARGEQCAGVWTAFGE
jgi:two-component system sensor histidine kinase BaeS